MKQHVKNLSSFLQGKSRKVTWVVVPSVAVILMALALSGCVKQKNCDGGIEGTFVYESIILNGKQYDAGKLYINNDFYYRIEGYIPKKLHSETPIKINACLERISSLAINPTIMKFTCVEKIK